MGYFYEEKDKLDSYGNPGRTIVPKIGRIISAVIGLFVVLNIVFGAWVVINPQEVGVVTRTGSLNRVLGEGLHWKFPFVESVTKMNVSEQKYESKNQVYSKDGQVVDTALVVNYEVNKVSVEKLYRETRNDYQTIILAPVLSPAVEEIFSKYTAQELIDKRAALSPEIKSGVITRVGERGIIIKGVEFTFDFDDQYEAAIKNKQVQEQQALAQVNITAQEKEKKAQEILKAEALAEKTRLEAQALASQQGEKVIAKIYAEAALKAADKWNGQLPLQMIPGQTLPFIQLGK